jgi:hypothetical protein
MSYRAIDIGTRITAPVDPGPAPMLQWIRIADLIIDETYQRPLGGSNWSAIQKIAANFLWSRFQPLLVAPIEGGRFAIIDGQHRAHAALLCGIEQVPAVAVMVGREEQSRSFAWVNSQTIKVTAWHVYKAALVAREDWALRAERATAAAGCKLMTYNKSGKDKQAGELYCVVLIRRLIDQGLDEAITAGLAGLRACPSMDRSAAFSDYILKDWIPAVSDSPVRNPEVLAAALALKNPFKVIEDARASLLPGLPGDKARKALGVLITEAVARRLAA